MWMPRFSQFWIVDHTRNFIKCSEVTKCLINKYIIAEVWPKIQYLSTMLDYLLYQNRYRVILFQLRLPQSSANIFIYSNFSSWTNQRYFFKCMTSVHCVALITTIIWFRLDLVSFNPFSTTQIDRRQWHKFPTQSINSFEVSWTLENPKSLS